MAGQREYEARRSSPRQDGQRYEKDEEADFLYAFNTELNLGNLGIAGEYAIHEKGNAYQVGANAQLGVLKLSASVLDIEDGFLTTDGTAPLAWGYGRKFDEERDEEPDNIEFARGLRVIDVGAEVPVGSVTLSAGYTKKDVPKLVVDGKKYSEADRDYVDNPWRWNEGIYDKRTVGAEMPIGPAKLVLAGGLGKWQYTDENAAENENEIDVKYGKVGIEDIPVVSGMTLDLTGTALRNTDDWAKEKEWKEGSDANKFKAAVDYDVTENMNVRGSFELKDNINVDSEDTDKYVKTVEAGADYRLDLGAVEVTPTFAFKKVLDSATDQMIAYGIGAKTTIFGAGIDASYLRRVGKGGRDEEYDSEDTILGLNLGYPIAEGVEFKLGGKYIDHQRLTWEYYDETDNKWKWGDDEDAPDGSDPSFVVKQVTAGISVAF